eukprot:scaffold99822_cov60-Phaeocystis_antarctica.AAC.1
MVSRTLKEKQGRLFSSASCSACSVTPTAKEVPTWCGHRSKYRQCASAASTASAAGYFKYSTAAPALSHHGRRRGRSRVACGAVCGGRGRVCSYEVQRGAAYALGVRVAAARLDAPIRGCGGPIKDCSGSPAWRTYKGCSLPHLRLQAPAPRVAASST